jgi:predicted CDP-diglyceride synthetase/phosphatidate cytidylyltransferase
MSYQEKENIVNIFSGLLITSLYGLIVYQRHIQGRIDLTEDFKTWGVIFLIFMGVSIVARIIIYIIFHIINAIATREEEIPVSDERVRLIKLKATRNAHYVFSVSFALGMAGLAVGMPVYGLFIVFVGGGLLSEIMDNSSQLYFHRKGI